MATYTTVRVGEANLNRCVKDIVPVVDIDQGLIEITPPAGLLDLKQKVGKKKM